MKAVHRKQHNIDLLFTVGLLMFFAIGAIMILLCAARIYTASVNDSARSNDAQTAVTYICEKVHQNDVSGNITTGTFDGRPCLIISQEYNGQEYRTYIYHYKNYLRELFVKSDFDASVTDGDEIIPVSRMKISKVNSNLLSIECLSSDGHRAAGTVAIRSK